MRDNPIQFAVVREDPAIEFDLVATRNCQRVLVIGSGGCTALSLQAKFPHLEITLVDPNPAQIALTREKMKALQDTKGAERDKLFNIGDDDHGGLNARGNFESLFRLLRDFIGEFILGHRELAEMFTTEEALSAGSLRLFGHHYWPVAFQLFFSDTMLLSMFGPAAIQHAQPGSYPRYFQQVLEQGLQAPQALKNYFLHHIFLGHYRNAPGCLPYYLANPVPDFRFNFRTTTASAIDNYGDYDLVGLSNVMDWMPESAIADLAALLARDMRPGALLVYRQLNHSKTFENVFGPRFKFDATARPEQMLAKDRSLFYSRLNVATKV
ncbi:MAG: DUF3419 family protein [Deltaproteobacteria bacterium]|nr:DUF3419 family protein [Deltaproteobacteria bacterium]